MIIEPIFFDCEKMMIKFLFIFLIVLSSPTKAELEDEALLGVKSYFDGNFENASKLLKRAALDGNAESQYLLGHMFEYGEGMDVDQKESFKWYLAAAKQGIAPAQYNVSLNYSFGIGTKKDLQLGLFWLRESARQGHDYAKFKLGLDLIEQANNEVERREGLMWLRIASIANLRDAQHTYSVFAPSFSIAEHASILLAANKCIGSSYTNCEP